MRCTLAAASSRGCSLSEDGDGPPRLQNPIGHSVQGCFTGRSMTTNDIIRLMSKRRPSDDSTQRRIQRGVSGLGVRDGTLPAGQRPIHHQPLTQAANIHLRQTGGKVELAEPLVDRRACVVSDAS